MAGDELIGVTGATGEVGGRVARRLADRGLAQRLVVRDPTRAPALDGAHTAGMTGYGDGESMRRALEGTATLLLVPGAEHPQRVDQHKTAIDAALAAGVRHIVYFSFVRPTPDSPFLLARHHWATEEHIRSTGMIHTFLRMNLYMDFIPFMTGDDGVIRGPAGDGRVGAVLRDDLADVAAAVLADPAPHAGAAYSVTGPESFTLADAAAAMSRTQGRDVRYVDETIEQAWESRRPTGAPDWEIEGWISSYVAIAEGEFDVVSDTVERIAGHPPVSLDQYLSASAAGPTSP